MEGFQIFKIIFVVSFDNNSQEVSTDKRPDSSAIQKSSAYSFEGKLGQYLQWYSLYPQAVFNFFFF